jgi:hypothetical protein
MADYTSATRAKGIPGSTSANAGADVLGTVCRLNPVSHDSIPVVEEEVGVSTA